jgi:hypothetical protein
MSPCEICEVEAGTLRCSHVGPLCFECWGSGIHEVMKRKSSELRKQLTAVLHTTRKLICGSKSEIPPVCHVCKEESHRWQDRDGSRRWHCIICNKEVAP